MDVLLLLSRSYSRHLSLSPLFAEDPLRPFEGELRELQGAFNEKQSPAIYLAL